MENSSLVEVTEVVAAVKRLSELSERMRAKSFGFTESDINHIDNIIDALHELELHKNNARDALETETIKCAAVRHKLMQFPDEINREIHEAVLAARQSNESLINQIKKQLQQLRTENEQVERLADEVEAENENLRPELTALKADYDASFVRLNELLAEKAASQIELNELRESIRVANARIVDLEENSLLLAETMVQERLRHADTLRNLREQTAEAEQRLRDCTAKENEKRQEFLAVHAILEQSSDQLNELVQENNSLEHEIAMLQVQQQDAMKQQAQVQSSNKNLKRNIEQVATQMRSMTVEHETRVAELQNTLEDLEEKSQEQAIIKEKAVAQKTEVTVRTVTIQANEEATKISKDTKENLKEAKKALATKAKDLSKMRQEILDMEGRRAELEDAERAEKEGWLNPTELLESNSVLTFNRQIAEWKEKLEQEMAERLTVESVRDKLQADIRQFNADDAAEVAAVNKEMDELKMEKAVLEKEQASLHSDMRSNESRSAKLSTQLVDERRQFEESRKAREAELDRLATELEQLRQEASRRKVELDDLKPKFDEFERFHQRVTGDYDALKRSLVALKNRKSGLEDSSKRTAQEVDRLTGEIVGLRREKERRTSQSQVELDWMVAEQVQLEREIYVLGCKLQTVVGENAKLKNGVDRLDRQIRSMQNSWEVALPAKTRIEQLRQAEFRQLIVGRHRDSELAEQFHVKDRHFLTVLATIIADTESRQAIVQTVANGLEAELACLDNYLKTSTDKEAEEGN